MKPETVSHYRLIRPLGAGGMGEVVEAHDTVLGRTVALKFLSPALAADPEARARFLREARAAAALTHPNIAVIHETGESGGRVFIVMEHVKGETLAARLSRGPVSAAEASTWGAAIADALAEAHARGLVHRDVKPANVMLTPDGRIKVLDFGLAKRAGGAASPEAATEALLTEPHALLGTPAYMAPEIWRGIEADPRSDVFALGVMLYEMLAGRRPFTGGSSHAVMAAILSETPPPAGEAVPGIPAALARVVDRAMARDPGARYPTAAELRDDLRRSIEAPDSIAPAAPSHLPAFASAFVGRARELGEVRALLAASRMVTLLGPGGAGKSRLAVEAVRSLPPHPDERVGWVDLAPVRGDGLVAATAAAVLDARPGPGETVEDALAAALASRRALLVLDNCEHLLEGCAALVHRLLSAAPGLRVLATSRERLRVEGERVYPVPSLDLPPGPQDPEFTLDATTASDAVRLFAERAGAARPGFRVAADNAAAVAAICRLLDGIPLALELAATRVPALGPEGLRRGLEHRFRLLTGGSRGAPERHRTLRAAMDWSYELLAPGERLLLARLSVFAGGADLDATEAVCAGDGVDAEDVPLLLARLHDKSMLSPVPGPGGCVRHRLLETVREYAGERLEESGEAGSRRERHASWFLAEAEKAAPELTGPRQRELMDRLERDRDNLRRALTCFADSGDAGRGLRMGAALWRWWSVRGRTDEGRAWFDRLLALPASDDQLPERARALRGAGALADDRSDFEAARALHEESLTLSRRLGDEAGEAASLCELGLLASETGDYATARNRLEASLAGFERRGDERGAAAALYHLGNTARDEGDYPRARALLEDSLERFRRLGDRQVVAAAVGSLGRVAFYQGDLRSARSLLEESATSSRQLGARQGEAWSTLYRGLAGQEAGEPGDSLPHLRRSLETLWELRDLRGVALALEATAAGLAERRPEAALRLAGAAETLREENHLAALEADRTRLERRLGPVRSRLGAKAAEASRRAGRRLPPGDAVAAALEFSEA